MKFLLTLILLLSSPCFAAQVIELTGNAVSGAPPTCTTASISPLPGHTLFLFAYSGNPSGSNTLSAIPSWSGTNTPTFNQITGASWTGTAKAATRGASLWNLYEPSYGTGTISFSVGGNFCGWSVWEVPVNHSMDTYTFTLTGVATVTAGAVYTSQGQSFTVTKSISSSTTLTAIGTGTPAGATINNSGSYGPLTLSSGSGTSPLYYSLVTQSNIVQTALLSAQSGTALNLALTNAPANGDIVFSGYGSNNGAYTITLDSNYNTIDNIASTTGTGGLFATQYSNLWNYISGSARTKASNDTLSTGTSWGGFIVELNTRSNWN